jgi:hypothetical protein
MIGTAPEIVRPSAPEPEEELGTVTPMMIHGNDRPTRQVFTPSAPIEITDPSVPNYDGKYQMTILYCF